MTEALTLCLSCATLTRERNGRSCAVCGEAFGQDRQTCVLDVADFIVRYGYHYRRHYEKAGAEDRSFIDFDVLWTFVGVAVLSGILGNAAYDLVRSAIGRIIKTSATSQPDRGVRRLLIDEEAFNKFSDYLEDYLRGMPELDPAIRSAISEEIFVHEIAREHAELLRKRGVLNQLLNRGETRPKLTTEELKEAHRLAKQRARKRTVASFESSSYFVGLWNGVPEREPTKPDRAEPGTPKDR